MMPSRRSLIKPSFIDAARLTRPLGSIPKVYVYVEDDIDTVFWRSFLDSKEYGCDFVISVYHVGDKEARGKDTMMMDALEGRLPLSSNCLLCLDSDLDLLVDNYHSYTDYFRNCPFIINTVWYSIESLKCFHPNVLYFLYQVSLTSNITCDIEKKFSEIGTLISRLFLISLVSHLLKDGYYPIHSLGKDLNCIEFEWNGNICDRTINEINRVISTHSHYELNHKADIEKFSIRLNTMGYSVEDYVYLILGHDFANKIVKPLIKAIGGYYRSSRLGSIGGVSGTAEHKKQLQEQYGNQTGVTNRCCLGERIDGLIRDCHDYVYTPVYGEIKHQIQRALTFGTLTALIAGLEKARM